MPTLNIMVGLPCSGKTTWAENNLPDCRLLSPERYIEAMSMEHFTSYDQALNAHYNDAQTLLWDRFEQSVRYQEDIIWDECNLTAEDRDRIIEATPFLYKINIIHMHIDFDEVWERAKQQMADQQGRTVRKVDLQYDRDRMDTDFHQHDIDQIITVIK